MTPLATLAGAITLRPGPAPPQIRSTRPALAGALVAGRAAAEVPERLAAAFALCGGAHRLAARAAVAAAEGARSPAADGADGDAVALQLDTLREHVRRIWLDWPPSLAGRAVSAEDLATLRDCPLLRRDAAAQALVPMQRWVEAHAIGMPAREWLAAWERQPAPWLQTWAHESIQLPGRLLDVCRRVAQALGSAPTPLASHAQTAGLRKLASSLRADADFASKPAIAGAPRETGPWARLNDAHSADCSDAWLRLGARLAELVRLALPDADGRSGARWLRRGALALAPGEGIAWCEMARGVLVHRVRLAAPRVEAASSAMVAEYDVLAPTEWNFHPDGAVALALARLPADAAESRVRLLAAAFDPCVEIRVERFGPNARATDEDASALADAPGAGAAPARERGDA